MKRTLSTLGFGALAVGLAAPGWAANSLSVSGAGALGGTSFGLVVTLDGAGGTAYVESDHPVDETHMLIRFRVNLQNLTGPQTGPTRHFRLVNIMTDGVSPAASKIVFAQRQLGTGNWRLIVWARDTTLNQFVFVGSLFLATFQGNVDAQIECEWTEATGAGSADGSFRCSKLGTAQTFQSTTLNDFGRDTDRVRLGIIDFDSFPGTGSYALDSYESFR